VTSDPVRQKPEFTDEQVELVRAELRRRQGVGRPAAWMAIAFEIAILQGCRLSATQIPMERVDLERGTVTLHEKGARGKPTVFTMPIHPQLRTLLERLKAKGKKITCELPQFASRNFSRVLRALGLPHTFHSTRVTVISRMARAGVPIQQAMAYVHHGSMAVHQIYQRLRPEDAGAAHAAIAYPAPSGPAPASAPRQSRDGRRATPRSSRATSSGRKR
jgi:integrase